MDFGWGLDEISIGFRDRLDFDSDFDPLDYILQKSRGTQIRIHAWFNVYYLWSSPQKPSQDGHVLLNHPDWIDTKVPDEMDVGLMLKKMEKDRKINGEGFYLAPTHPEVEAHLQNIITELLQNYRLGGIHFDYIRYLYGDAICMAPKNSRVFLDLPQQGS